MRRSSFLEAVTSRAASAQLDSVTGRDLERTAGFLVADARGRVVGMRIDRNEIRAFV
jgi:hypothetical protein